MIIPKPNLNLRVVVVFAFILVGAALRVAPHPWNFTPIGAMALFAGAMIRDRRVAFVIPLVTLFAGDIVIGFHKLIPFVYVSFLVSVLIGGFLRNHTSPFRVAGATLLGAVQFFLVTNFAVWALLGTYPRTATGLAACYAAGIPYFWNTLAGDALYAACLFGGFALVEHFVPALRQQELARA
ncbi:MAG TPA: DUF6580 family putative transport protein [Candidatus Dormibacteraeota bacterium]|nr:DUF6580 family putative transport protein [Candidatus Dormibacteraeota bacterium]